jgi:acyl carrier protein
MGSQSTEATIREYILREFLEGEDPGELEDDTPLISSGILDSIATLKLVSFLEETFGIALAPHEADEEYLGTIGSMAKLVRSKLGGQ